MSRETGILPQPLGPDPVAACPECGRKNALVFVRRDPDEQHEWISVYRCRFCGAIEELAFANPIESV